MMGDTPAITYPCPLGLHRYHRSRELAEQCQRQAEIMAAGRPFAADDPRVSHRDDVRRQGSPSGQVRPL